MSVVEVHDLEPQTPKPILNIVPNSHEDEPWQDINWLAEIQSPEEQQIAQSLVANRKWIDGYEAAGTFVRPNLDMRLRAVRNIATSTGAYKLMKDLPADKIKNHVKSVTNIQRTVTDEMINPHRKTKSQTIFDILGPHLHDSTWQTFIELGVDRDPLAICLAQLWKDGTMNYKEFDELVFTSVTAFRPDIVKAKMLEQVKRIKLANSLAKAALAADTGQSELE